MAPRIKEFQGKNIKAAVENARGELMLGKEELNYKILSHGSTGIFGIVGNKPALIQVVIPDLGHLDKNDSEVSDGIETEKETGRINFENQVDMVPGGVVLQEEDAIAAGRETLQKIIDTITDGGAVHVDKKKHVVRYDIESADAGMLIGKKGQTLDSIQYIIDKVVNAKSGFYKKDKPGRRRIRVQVDVADYLEKRRKGLVDMAKRAALQVKNEQQPETLGYYHPRDRKTIHLAIKKISGVYSSSIGDGKIRKLVVFPKMKQGNQKR